MDPEDWGVFRKLAHTALDAAIDLQVGIREQPAWREVSPESKRHFETEAPMQPQAASSVVEEAIDHVLAYPTGNLHPR